MPLDPIHISILQFAFAKGGTGNVMEALGWDASKHEEGFGVALVMENLNYVKLLYSNFNKNLVVVELTLIGTEIAKK